MRSEEPQSYRYEYQWFGGPLNAFGFETQKGIRYEVIFKNTPYLFGSDSEYSALTYEFSILIAENENGFRPSFDKLIAPTIAAIFYDYFEKGPENIIIYICDSSDQKQFIRKVKFDRWFDHFKGINFLKVDEFVIDRQGIAFPVSLILKRENPAKIEIVYRFVGLVDKWNEGK